jgi:hypothetical protein
MLRNVVLYSLAYVGCFSVAIWFARALLWKLAVQIGNELWRSLLCLGLPVFVFTTCFNWFFPSQLTFAEHVGCNLVLALLISFSWRYPTEKRDAQCS